MAVNERKRQKKLAKKAAKHKATLALKKRNHPLSQTRHFIVAPGAPIHECLVSEGLFDIGIGNLLISRKMPDGNIAFCVFLLDIFCLGVKNALFAIRPKSIYDEKVISIKLREDLKSIDHACARKLVEGAEAYAKDLGFSPHPDYLIAKKILRDIDTETCPMSFEFGKDGKPFFISGPNDTPSRCKKIINTLEERCGPDGFHFLVNTPEEIIDEY